MQRERTPSWVGPVTTVLLILVLAGIGVLLWLTVFAAGEEHGESGAEPAARHVQRTVSVSSYPDLLTDGRYLSRS
jgi:autotransporter translocation and assembly factor TamB